MAEGAPEEKVGEGESPKWVQIQQKTFTKWMNNHLSKKKFGVIGNCQNDFEDGIKLMELINALYEIPFPPKYNKAPKMRPHKLDNLNLAFAMLEEAKVKTNFLKTTHLIDKDLKMILGMIWAIILDYAIKGISVEDMNAKEGLLLWCKKKTAGYRDIDPPGLKNFHKDWSNGLAFCALIHKHRPDLLDYNALDKNNAAQNLELAFSVAEKELGIPRLLDVEDVRTAPDERSIMTYVSEYFHRFAKQDEKGIAAGRVANFLKFLRGMAERQDEYARRAKLYIGWIDSKIGDFKNQDFGSTLGEAQASQAAYREFVVKQRPPQDGERLDIENLFAEIQTSLRVNNRKPYVPPEGLAPEDLDAASDRLSHAQKHYAAAIRENRYKYITKVESKISDEKMAEMKDAFKHFDKNKNGTLDKLEFKAALSAMSVFFASDAEFESIFSRVSEGAPNITQEQYIAYLTTKYEDKDSPDQIKESFKAVAGAPTITAAGLRYPPLSEEDAVYLEKNMPQASDGSYDYNGYVDSVFS